MDPVSFPFSKLEEMPISFGSHRSVLPQCCTSEPGMYATLYLHTLQLLPDIHLPSRLKITAQVSNHTANNRKERGREKEVEKPKKPVVV